MLVLGLMNYFILKSPFFLACASNKWDIIKNLPVSSFTVNRTCPGEDPANVRFGQSGFTLCTKRVKVGKHMKYDNFLTINLLQRYTFSALKITDLQVPNKYQRLNKFTLQISRDGVEFFDYKVIICLHLKLSTK